MSIVARVPAVHDGGWGVGGGRVLALFTRGLMGAWVNADTSSKGCSLLALFKALCWSRSTASEGRKEKREGGLSFVTVNCISDQCFRCPGPDQSDPPCHGAEERATDTITASNGLINSLCGVSRRYSPCRSRFFSFFFFFFHLTG